MFKQLTKNNLSFVLSIIAAACIFFPSLLLKDAMDASEYGEFSLLITIISIVYSFGVLGSEQVLNRLAVIEGDTLELNKRSLNLLWVSCLIVTPALFVLLNVIIDHSLSTFYIMLILILSSLSMLMYNVCRLMSKFMLAQTILNFWKFCIALSFLVITFLELKFVNVFITILVPSFLVVLSMFYREFKNYSVSYSDANNSSVYPFFFASLINMGAITLLGYGDRFLIEHNLGIEKMGEYYYMMTIYVFPFIIFANYVGFKKLISYKKNKDFSVITKDITYALFGAIVLGLLIYFIWLVMITLNYWEHKTTISYPILFLILGGVRLIYSVVSAAIGAKALPKVLLLSNIIFLFVIIFSISIFPMNTMLSIIHLVIFLWLLRVALGWYVIKRSIAGAIRDN